MSSPLAYTQSTVSVNPLMQQQQLQGVDNRFKQNAHWGKMQAPAGAPITSAAQSELGRLLGANTASMMGPARTGFNRSYATANAANTLASQQARSASSLGMGNYLLGRQRQSMDEQNTRTMHLLQLLQPFMGIG